MRGALPLDADRLRQDELDGRRDVVPLHDRAAENLRFIRETMERAGAFTAVPGRGMVAVGMTALAAVLLGPRQVGGRAWLLVWLAEGALALALGALSLTRKARALGLPLWSGPARRFFLTFSPPLLVGAVLTAVAAGHGLTGLLPGLWLLLYGTAVLCGGAQSVRVVPIMGSTFMVLGGVALFAPAWLGTPAMAIGFGGLHVIYGVLIARWHGG
jgi:hypothetical protein